MEYYVEHYTYAGVIILLLLGGFGVPLPEDMPLIFGGYFCYKYPDSLNIWIMLAVCFSAVMAGDLIMYTLGRVWGDKVKTLPFLRRYLTPDRLEKARLKFHEHGGKTLFIARFLPGLRTATFFSAGVFRIPAWKMIAFDGTAALLSVPALVLLPYYLGAYFDKLKDLLKESQLALISLLLLMCVFYYIYWRLRSERAKARASANTLPPSSSQTTPEP